MGGADVIDGDAGADVITGGAGRDTISGGAGSDQFIFLSRAEMGDTIVDFGDVAGNQDQLRISASALGGGLTAGAVAASVFITRSSDHAAQQADDRFILNNADKTLWFDADGNGAGAAILVVDLQNNTTFGAGDMLLL
jgi:Ca2+-binding RTX toxin-like protein